MPGIDIQSSVFEALRKAEMIYVDKTDYFLRLAANRQNRRLFFLARPRRFGKSLMISTFKAIFEGKRELFEGLAIAKTDYDWQPYPVIHLDMSLALGGSLEQFQEGLRRAMRVALQECNAEGFAFDEALSATDNLNHALRVERPVVLLIDEYDAPICHTLNYPELCERIRGELADFYAVLKGRQAAIRFAMITGISKFASLSIFSGLNNLIDLTTDPDYATMLGYTEQELTENFGEHIARRAAEMGLSLDDFRAGLAKWFNGYRFARKAPATVYNPVSIARTLTSREDRFEAQWATTGRPSLLANFLRRDELLALDFEKPIVATTHELFMAARLDALAPIPVLYQTGYLTIKSYDPDFDSFELGIPDEEVRRDLMAFTYELMVPNPMTRSRSLADLGYARLEDFLKRDLPDLYAKCYYGPTEGQVQEYNYQRMLQVFFLSRGFEPITEATQSSGKRADLVVKVPGLIYLFEFKADGSTAEEALAQIKEKNYAAPYLHDGRPIVLIGLAFQKKSRELQGIAYALLNDSSAVHA